MPAAKLAMRLRLALECEDAGDRVAHPKVGDVRPTLAARGFRAVTAERYGINYRYEPGREVRWLSHEPLLALAESSFRAATALAGPLSTKLAVKAVGE